MNTGTLLAKFLVVVMIAARLTPGQVSIPTDKSSFHLFAMMGQSNMTGAGGVVIPEDTVSHPRLLKYWPLTDTDGTWITQLDGDSFRVSEREWMPGIAPIGPQQWDPTSGVGRLGLDCGRSFALRLLAEDSSLTIGMIQIGVSGSSLLPWTKGGVASNGDAYYDGNIALLRAAMEDGTLKGILWHQGEAGTGCDSCDYAEMIEQMIADYRADLGVPALPFLASLIGTEGDVSGTVNKALLHTDTAVVRTAVVTSEGYTLHDPVHYDRAGQMLMGERFAQAYLAEFAGAGTREPGYSARPRVVGAGNVVWNSAGRAFDILGRVVEAERRVWSPTAAYRHKPAGR